MKQKAVLDERTLNNLLRHVISSTRCCPSVSVYDNLKLLGELLYENGVKCREVQLTFISLTCQSEFSVPV